jgi:hypothetical protein
MSDNTRPPCPLGCLDLRDGSFVQVIYGARIGFPRNESDRPVWLLERVRELEAAAYDEDALEEIKEAARAEVKSRLERAVVFINELWETTP